MHTFFAALLTSLLVSTAMAASLPSGSAPSVSHSTLTRLERIAARRAVRLRGTSRSSVRIPVKPLPVMPARPSLRSSSSSYSYTGTPVRGVLQIDQVSTGSSENAAGTEGVTLMSFDATVANEDVILSTLKFRAETGSLSAAGQYELLALSANGRYERVAFAGAPAGTTLVFGNLQVRLHPGPSQRFIVQGRLRTSLSASSLGLAFAVSDPLFIQAHGVTYGRDLTPGIQVDDQPCPGPFVCRVIVHTRAARSITVNAAGNLFVTRDSVSVPARQLLLGTRSDAVLRLKFHATEEDVAVTYLAIAGFTDSVSGVELFLEDSSMPFATARQLQCESVTAGQFCATVASGLFTVPQDGEVRVVARAVMTARKEGGTSGDAITPALSALTVGNVAVKAQGKSSGRVLSQNDGDTAATGEIFVGRETPGGNTAITGSTHDAAAAKLAGIANASTDADNTAVPFGTSTFAKFRFTAAPNTDTRSLTLKTLVFTVSATNVQVDSGVLRLFNPADSSLKVPCSASGITGTITVTCANLDTSGLSTEIDQGNSLTLGLQSILYPGTTGGTSILQTSLSGLGDRTNPGTIEWTDGTTTFGWVDLPVTQVRSTQYRS